MRVRILVRVGTRIFVRDLCSFYANPSESTKMSSLNTIEGINEYWHELSVSLSKRLSASVIIKSSVESERIAKF